MLDSGELELLRIWSEAGPTRLARKASVVLELARGAALAPLASSFGIPRNRLAALVGQFERISVLALFDAPRAGRSPVVVPSKPASLRSVAHRAGVQEPLHIVSAASWRDWRSWRLEARNEGGHRRRRAWPAVQGGPWEQVRAISVGPAGSVILLRAGRSRAGVDGHWFFPRLGFVLANLPERTDTLDWRTLLGHLHDPRVPPDKPRAVHERRRLWIEQAFDPQRLAPAPRTLLAGGDPLSTEFHTWLAALRPVAEMLDRRGQPLHLQFSACLESWQAALRGALGDGGSSDIEDLAAVAAGTWRPPTHLRWAAERC